ncbi:putative uncharacterized protein DDB_G0271982 [Episyrphus balteatus]|uniref:putative uncharacterized protein DDB_G0271982 n=1 Tax=Episyrphus balteatus TaxID=286459 RepID=UPI0024854D09|nr:putative uncharacterized protein DDB_G0271982 [Episyrphus balteatus]XP_055842937.1 putative uncharacterized protein DDB_G0271982 [Episyrphus balteatus]XP_055842939.1 putative uncharacterized protein DDB_G0271982 [Episyrphus balteatus]XP_055842940.1 putative uncharacterized protein DDB_G0271982 [Episyrphus balteatus]
MAFYSRSVNDVGIEIDRPKSCKEYESRFYQKINTLSDRASTASRQSSSVGGIYSRYINPAVCVAKPDTSMESLSDELPSIVPPLDLNSSGETMPSTDSAPGVSYTIQKICEDTKISQLNAYHNWLSGKKRLKANKEAKQKEIEQERQRQLEERKQLAEEKYQQWLAKKTQPKEKPLLQTEMQEYQKVCQSHDDSESNRKAWEQKKLDEQRRKREKELKLREQQKILEEQRKQKADRAWQSWLAEAPLKPKPVPLNKGFFSLKGTISDIYVNPNPWREPFEPLDEVECD